MLAHFKKFREHLGQPENILFLLTFIYTLVYLTLIYVHFFTNGKIRFNPAFTGFYLPLLSFYVGNKELNRWYFDEKLKYKPGELVVAMLWLTPPVLFAIEAIYPKDYHIPIDLKSSAMYVMGLFIASAFSKKQHGKKTDKCKPSQ